VKKSGRSSGYLFVIDLREPSLKEFHDMFYEALEEVQALRPDIIAGDVDVRDSYGIKRSLRRGATSHARNMDVKPDIINAISRWSTKKKSDKGSGDMADVYSRLDKIAPALLRYSKSF
jgi:hypothetical protein